MSQNRAHVRDPIHHDIPLGTVAKKVISSPYFQRLRNIKQNGLLFLIYPGMQHSRFEHSIGVSHVAGRWLDEIVESDLDSLYRKDDLPFDSGVELRFRRSRELFKSLRDKKELKDRWKNIVTLAGLFHDCGHGPFSHTFEELDLLKRSRFISASSGDIKNFLQTDTDLEGPISHEEISLIYCSRIRSEVIPELSQKDLNLVASLISKTFRKYLVDAYKAGSDRSNDEDVEMLYLLSPLISGQFDADKMDYLIRDSRMAGVSYGQVDTHRLMRSVVPVLVTRAGVLDVAYITRARNVHAMDHFLVSLFEMYTQLYNHPSNLQIQHEVKLLVDKLKDQGLLGPIVGNLDFENHSKLFDQEFIRLINANSDNCLTKIMSRTFREENRKVVHQLYGNRELPKKIKDEKWERLEAHGREMLKDKSEVWLVDRVEEELNIFSWTQASIVAQKLSDEEYSPSVWWKNDKLTTALNAIKNNSASGNEGESASQGSQVRPAGQHNV